MPRKKPDEPDQADEQQPDQPDQPDEPDESQPPEPASADATGTGAENNVPPPQSAEMPAPGPGQRPIGPTPPDDEQRLRDLHAAAEDLYRSVESSLPPEIADRTWPKIAAAGQHLANVEAERADQQKQQQQAGGQP